MSRLRSAYPEAQAVAERLQDGARCDICLSWFRSRC